MFDLLSLSGAVDLPIIILNNALTLNNYCNILNLFDHCSKIYEDFI